MKMFNDFKGHMTKSDWILMGLAGVGIAILIWLGGCESTPQEASQQSEQTEKLTDLQKSNNEIKEAIDGSNNQLTTEIQNTKVTMQDIRKEIMNMSMQNSKSAAATADRIDNLKQDITNTQNSTVLMSIIIGLLTVVVIVLILVVFWVVRRLFSLKFQVQRVFAAEDNNLTEEIFNRHA